MHASRYKIVVGHENIQYLLHSLTSSLEDFGMSPRSALIHSLRAGKVCVDNVYIKTKCGWKLINYRIKLTYIALNPAHPHACSVVLQNAVLKVTAFCLDAYEREA